MLSDLAMVAVAAGAWVGAELARPTPVALAALVAAVALWRRRAVVLVAAVLVAASGLAASAWAALAPAPDGPVTARVRLATDPEERLGAQVVVVVLPDGRRVQAWARGRAASPVAHLLAGETIEVAGRLEGLPEGSDWLRRAHVSNRLVLDRATAPGPASPPWAVANRVRRLLEQGSVGLPYEQRALFAGFVLGDDREQDPATLDAFRVSGLSHLLVVSGQNVAFVLIVARPVLARLGRRSRLVATLLGLGLFAVLTRFEPSVLRATAMAAVAAAATTVGRPASGARVLALAVTGLVLLDPLLAGTLGFRLSVAASLGIVVVAPRLEEHLRGPRWLVGPLSVTVGAQLGVAPVLVPAFGPMPLVAVPANLLAEPVAGLVMAWGTSGGLAAGLASAVGWHGAARLLQVPTRLGLTWIGGVADVAAAHPQPAVGLPIVLGVVAAVGASTLVRRRSPGGPPVVRAAAALAVGLVAGVSAAVWVPIVDRGASATGVEVLAGRDGGAPLLLVDGRADAGRALDAVRRWGLPSTTVAVARSGSAGARTTVVALRERGLVSSVLAAPAAGVPEAEVVGPDGHEVVVAEGTVRLVTDPDDPARLDVDRPDR